MKFKITTVSKNTAEKTTDLFNSKTATKNLVAIALRQMEEGSVSKISVTIRKPKLVLYKNINTLMNHAVKNRATVTETQTAFEATIGYEIHRYKKPKRVLGK